MTPDRMYLVLFGDVEVETGLAFPTADEAEQYVADFVPDDQLAYVEVVEFEPVIA